ncbi:MAG TPA: histidine kinase dimerization/phospho-acceptor domain-containing protein [Anaeromyxobacter sp.]|nr:histidine kinase dimerization/phospho-acceptor domain-containing protein [Anaeromyxobacter sp.]HVO21626.1 histidine kinase dimerization/phospho-acceptor domain-containing protein [Anaeromyxobacter sp.]
MPASPATGAGRDDPSLAAGTAALLRYRRRTFRFGALLIASCWVIDLFQPHLAEVAVVRVLWVAAVLVAASLQRPERPRLANLSSHLGSLATGAAVVAIVALDGGTSSVYVGMLLATPFAVLVAMVELPTAAALNGAICVAGGAAIRLWEGQPWIQVVSWLLLSTVMTALATWGTIAARRAWRMEVAAERRRWQALEQLAESERQRAEAQRFAEVGRLAAHVAHEVNNPLSVVKSNVQWLGQGTGSDGGEREQVVADTLASVERIVEAVDEVRRRAGDRLARSPQGAVVKPDR